VCLYVCQQEGSVLGWFGLLPRIADVPALCRSVHGVYGENGQPFYILYSMYVVDCDCYLFYGSGTIETFSLSSHWPVDLGQYTMKQLLSSLLDESEWGGRGDNSSVVAPPTLWSEWSPPGCSVFASLSCFLLMKVYRSADHRSTHLGVFIDSAGEKNVNRIHLSKKIKNNFD